QPGRDAAARPAGAARRRARLRAGPDRDDHRAAHSAGHRTGGPGRAVLQPRPAGRRRLRRSGAGARARPAARRHHALATAPRLRAAGRGGAAATPAGPPADRAADRPGPAARRAAAAGRTDPPAGDRDRGAAMSSWLERRNPTVKLAVLTAVSLGTLFLFDPAPLLALYLLAVLAVRRAARVRRRTLLAAQVPFLLFGVGLVAVNALSRPGQPLWPEAPVRVTVEGVVIGAALALRGLVIG